MATDYYTHGSTPSTGSPGSSSVMRAEFDLIEAGFAKLPSLSGNGGKVLLVNPGGSAVTLTTGTLALAGPFITSGGHSITLTSTGATNVTLPTTGTLVTRTGTETLTNKTITSPVLSGTATGTYTLTAPVLSGTVTGTYTLGGTASLSGTVTGTYTLGGSPTIASPALSGTVTGTYTLAGSPTLSNVQSIALGGSGFIDFPATGFGTPETTALDVYEVGEWTPSIGGTATYTARLGRYVRLGKFVFVYGYIHVNTRGTGSQTTVDGLPFFTKNEVTAPILSIGDVTSLALSVVSIVGKFGLGGSAFLLYSRTAAATQDLINNVIGNGTKFSFSGWYEVD